MGLMSRPGVLLASVLVGACLSGLTACGTTVVKTVGVTETQTVEQTNADGSTVSETTTTTTDSNGNTTETAVSSETPASSDDSSGRER